MRKTWSIISDALNKKVKLSIPDIMSVNGEKCSDKARISEHINSFFTIIGSQNEKNIRRHEGSTYQNYLTNQYDSSFAFHLNNNNDRLRIIKKNIKMFHSKCYDGISTQHLKLIKKDLSKCLILRINRSLKCAVNARVGVEWEQPLLTKCPNGYATHTASDSKVLTLPSRGGTVSTNRERRKARHWRSIPVALDRWSSSAPKAVHLGEGTL